MNAPAELSLSQFRHVDDKSRLLAKSPHYGKFFEIYESMLEADFVKRGIKELEERMWDELKRRIKTENFATDLLTAGTQQQRQLQKAGKVDGNKSLKSGFKDHYATGKAGNFDVNRKHANINKGLLTTILTSVEQKYGFGPVSYAWGTSGEHFLTNLKARRPFKDYGAAANHGDNTHRIQWFMICEFLCEGIADAAKFYEETAYWTTTVQFTKNIGNNNFQLGNHEIYLWDFLCDNASNTTGWTMNMANGLSPIYVMEQLQSDDYPLLSAFVKYRKTKDMKSRQESANYQDYEKTFGVASKTLHRAALRFYSTPFAAMNEDQRRALAEFLGTAGFTDAAGPLAG